MRFTSITFEIENTMPLITYTKDPQDQYANIKPRASVTVAFDADDPTDVKELEKAKGIVKQAFDEACDLAFAEIVEFRKEFAAMYEPKGGRRK